MGSTEKNFRAEAVYPIGDPPFVQFPSRRSVVHSTKGMVACTQPLAAEAGQRILKMGGNAAVGFFCDISRLSVLTFDSGCCRSDRFVLVACPVD